MNGRRPLWVAKQHGHSITTMLNVYAAWTDEANEVDLDAIKCALSGAPRDIEQREAAPTCTAINPTAPTVVPGRATSDRPTYRDLALNLALSPQPEAQLPENWREILAEREGFEPSKGF
jgi:hypothetical protein